MHNIHNFSPIVCEGGKKRSVQCSCGSAANCSLSVQSGQCFVSSSEDANDNNNNNNNNNNRIY